MIASQAFRRGVSALSSLFVVSHASAAWAQSQGFALNRFDPAEHGSDWFANESLDLRGEGRLSFGVVGDYAHKPLVLYGPDGSERQLLVGDQMFLHLGGGVILANRLRLGLNLPVAVYEKGERAVALGSTFAEPASSSVGDLRLSADLRLVGEYGAPITAAAGVQAHLPTGKQEDYTSDGKVRLVPRFMVAGDVDLFVYAARLGLAYRAFEGSFANSPVGTELTWSVAAGVRLAERNLIVGPELYGSTVATSGDSFFQKKTTPLEIIFGAHYTLAQDFHLGLGVGPGLTRGYGTPQLRGLLSVEWIPAVVAATDRDGDGVLDTDDACPDTPGEKSDDPKKNGCPATAPAPDRDKDGVPDADDACPDTPGVKSDDPKKNGCPPLADRDKDGIPDSLDACLNIPGVETDDPKTNGCPAPPPDRDNDAIVDQEDACPDAAGPKDADPKKNGCPEARIEAGEIKILQQVKFKTGSADILPVSDTVLTAVASILRDHPEIKAVRVEGHTDDRGALAMNNSLSARRAASVARWLTAHGVDKARLTSEGFGPTRPIDSNESEEGRANNRRVEFHIQLDEKK